MAHSSGILLEHFSAVMLRHPNRPYICWRCINPSLSGLGRSGHVPLRRSAAIPKWVATQSATPTAAALETIGIPTPQNDGSGETDHDQALPIRDRLRQWASRNDAYSNSLLLHDTSIYGSIANNVSRTQSTGSSELDQLRSPARGVADSNDANPTSSDAETSTVASHSRSPGDLVELRQMGSRMPVFAVYLGYFGQRNHFYAVNGKWVTSMGFSSLFTVSRFASLQEMEPVLAKIPYDATPEQFDEMRQDEKGPSREDGVMLIDKMTEFRRTSEAIYQANMTRLDSARAVLGDASGFEYISLFDIADMLLPGTLKTGQEFPAPALYAVHTALSRSEIGFNPMSPSADCHRRDHLFEVLPQSHAQTIARVAAWVGEYTDLSAKKLRPLKPGELEEIPLGRFIRQARDAVAHSRRSREWTPHGILKPSAGVTLPRVDWSPVSKEVIAFLEWWASYNLFDAGSRFHSYGALILRSLDLYREAALDQSTAWTFLQEIGVISPWEVPSRYKVRFPGSTIDRGGGISRSIPDDLEKSMRCDIAEGARKPVEGATVFCIDAPSTVIIDDGVSLERTSRPDEFWIHVHVADPASVIRPDSELAKFMELIPENIYLPGHFQAMLPPEVGQVGQDGQDGQDGAANSTSAAAGLVQRFSLQPGAPALTFSAKVNRAGDMLAYQVEPSTLRSVTYLDPEDVSSFCGEPPPPPVDGSYSFSVGTPPDETVAGTGAKRRRPMTRTRDLDEPSRADLLTLHGLCEAIRQKRLSRGAWPYFFPRPSVSVSFHEATPEGGACLGAAAALPPDPYIEVGAESSNGCSVVANAMVLAGQVAARWCWTRGIPIPYRRDSHSADDKLRQAALEYATRELYPLIRKGIEPSAGQRQALALLTGGIQISLEPGPYLLLGLDMYAKVTSPLRRFSDLLVHWQMHAALAHERRTAHAPSSDPAAAAAADSLDEVLPFSAAALGDSLPLLHTREKMARTVARGTVDWMLMALVRAWRFEGKAPRSLRFVVGSRWRQGLLGRLDMLGLDAIMDLAGLDGCRLIRDVQVGDEFEVHLADVNVHSQQILVKAIRYLGAARRPEAA